MESTCWQNYMQAFEDLSYPVFSDKFWSLHYCAFFR